jgi:UDP-GlcNAc:undecaprenyl-phosphate GlcNAc-1-phosphate transferase
MAVVAGVIVAIGAVTAWLAGFLVRRFAPRWGLVDVPTGRKDHAAPTPLGGGLAIAAGMLTAVVALTLSGERLLDVLTAAPPGGGNYERLETVARMVRGLGYIWYAWIVLAGAGLVSAIGLADDLRGLGWKLRLAVQCLAAAAVVWLLDAQEAQTPAALIAGLALPTLWIVGLVNSINMLDNMNGLAGGVTAICGSFLALCLPLTIVLGLFCCADALLWALVGGALGFLWHNFPAARLFMGDAGSYLCGFLLGSLSALAAARGDEAWPARLAPLLVFAVPMYDMCSVLSIRLRAGRSPFAADHSHVSHRLVALGLTRPQAVLAICVATAVTGGLALALSRASESAAPLVLASILAIVLLAAVGELIAHQRRSASSLHDRS